MLRTLTDLDDRATVVSVDGIGAFDLISRQAMLSGLRDMEYGEELMPFVSAFNGSPSTYLWEDELGAVHEIQQGEGGEQGDALMPMLFSLGQHPALVAIAAQFLANEKIVRFPRRPVLRPSRRLVLVADGEHVEASTQRASFVPTWRDATDNEDMVDALQHDLEGDPQRAQSGWAEVEQEFGELIRIQTRQHHRCLHQQRILGTQRFVSQVRQSGMLSWL